MCRWQIPSNYFLKDFEVNGVTMRGIFVDSNPFITKYNGSAQYNRQYFIDHVSLSLFVMYQGQYCTTLQLLRLTLPVHVAAVESYLHQSAAAVHLTGHEQLHGYVDIRGLPLSSVWHSSELWE